MKEKETILVLDFGSPTNQLLTRRLRELGVYSELRSHKLSAEDIRTINPAGIILSGGGQRVQDDTYSHYDKRLFKLGIPVLGIGYGMRLMAAHFDGKVSGEENREGEHAAIRFRNPSHLLQGMGDNKRVEMDRKGNENQGTREANANQEGNLEWKESGNQETNAEQGSSVEQGVNENQGARVENPEQNFDAKPNIWMSPGEKVAHVPEHFQIDAVVVNSWEDDIVAAMSYDAKQLYGISFYPEAEATECGMDVLKSFAFNVCGCSGTWSMVHFITEAVADIKANVGDKNVLCALSGGVDSSVAAALVHRAIGDQLTCVFVDHGLLRKNEADDVMQTIAGDFDINVIHVDARERFLSKLAGVADPEEKRKIIGNEFIYVFDDEADKLKNIDFLAQGTLYTDVIESGTDTTATIKSHHNVGGLPEDMELDLLEPLNVLFKDEVRALGTELGLPDRIVWRQPFPGPGLAIRVLGEVTPEKLKIVRESDAILREEIAHAGLERDIWQYFTVLPNIRSVGVKDGARTYDHTVGIRAVTSVDGTSSDWARIPWDVLERVSRRMVDEVEYINRVVYDVTSKPPSTIEWE